MSFAPDLTKTKCRVYELSVGGVDVGLIDDIQVEITPDLAERRCQQFHNQVMGHRLLGVSARITGTLRQITAANLLAQLPWATGGALTPASMGADLYDSAVAVKLHPRDMASATTEDINLLKCGRINGLIQSMDGQSESGIPIEFHAYPDRTQLPSVVIGYVGAVPSAGT